MAPINLIGLGRVLSGVALLSGSSPSRTRRRVVFRGL